MTQYEPHMSRLLTGLALLAVLLPAPLLAATSPWAETQGGRMRLVALPPDAAGRIKAVLQIEPAPGFKTYWREPGSSGIPPQISLSADSNTVLQAMRFPVPQVFDEKGLRDYGYDRPAGLVLDLQQSDIGSGSKLTASAFIGLCDTICIPFQAEFSLDLKPGDAEIPAEKAAVKIAETLLAGEPADDFQVVSTLVSGDGQAVDLTVRLPDSNAGTTPKFILAGPGGRSFKDPVDLQREDDRVTARFRLATDDKTFSLANQTGLLLVTYGLRTMETPLVFK